MKENFTEKKILILCGGRGKRLGSITKKIPKINFQILTPHANKINTPKISILKAVPKSGCMTTNKKGMISIKKGKNKFIIFLTS